MRNPPRHVSYDRAAMIELDRWIHNSESLGRQELLIVLNLLRKIQRGIYDRHKAPRLWQYVIDQAAREYCHQAGCTVKDTFPLPLRRHIAKQYTLSFERQLRAG